MTSFYKLQTGIQALNLQEKSQSEIQSLEFCIIQNTVIGKNIDERKM